MLFYTQNKFHLDRKYVKMKYKIKARNNGSVYFMFCLVFVFNIGVECASLSPKGQDNLKKNSEYGRTQKTAEKSICKIRKRLLYRVIATP